MNPFGNRWVWKQYPEFDEIPLAQRDQIFKRAARRSFRRWQTWIAAFLVFLPMITAAILMKTWARPFRGQIVVSFIIQQVLLIIGMAVFLHWNMRSIARSMREALPHLCINCGYDLRATPERCPECGTIRETDHH